VNDLAKKGFRRVSIIKCLSTKNWGQSLESQRSTYITYVRSCLEYASSSWWPWISATARTRLERVQNAGLRAVAGLVQGCPLDFLRLETDVEPLSNRMDKNDNILLDKYLRLPEDDPRRQLAERQAPVRLKT